MRQIAGFPFGHRHRWAEGRQQVNFGEMVGGFHHILFYVSFLFLFDHMTGVSHLFFKRLSWYLENWRCLYFMYSY